MKLKNYMEDVVFHLLLDILKDMDDVCKCEKCVHDIAALSLNRLKPQYVVTEKGEAYSKVLEMYTQFQVDVTTVILESIEQVSRNPRH
ncbi:MAG: hypothetical protein HPY66_3431 [Firmicutes bacterium]|nr:hypothetical protein [Bacillota bacterium]MDI6705414.1 late competence development ComFB family protein [Bacillota bacterium]